MFIRPMGVTVRAANRPAGRPLLRGLLARASGTGTVGPEDLPRRDVRPAPAPDPDEERDEPDWGEWSEPEEDAEDGTWPQEEPDAPEPAPEHHPHAAEHGGLAAELAQLAGLAREGLLTPHEFATAKAKLLRD
ncbi:hypothetical protein ACIPRL_01180 [Streptomyces sp. NPDC090085]|uniref:hypothetical protein n=1 Tax=unclassified Streptomyces TaxID=2593676 RepID=UPI0038011DE0